MEPTEQIRADYELAIEMALEGRSPAKRARTRDALSSDLPEHARHREELEMRRAIQNSLRSAEAEKRRASVRTQVEYDWAVAVQMATGLKPPWPLMATQECTEQQRKDYTPA
eukprot:3939386-Rhodomonas_salina.8